MPGGLFLDGGSSDFQDCMGVTEGVKCMLLCGTAPPGVV